MLCYVIMLYRRMSVIDCFNSSLHYIFSSVSTIQAEYPLALGCLSVALVNCSFDIQQSWKDQLHDVMMNILGDIPRVLCEACKHDILQC